jgi:hypothetical protein
MNAEYFRDLYRRQPFEPFAIHLSNGEVHPIRHPELATLTRSRIVMVDPDADRIKVCSVLHIASLEMLQSAA